MKNGLFVKALKETFGSKAKIGEDAAEAAHAALFNRGCRKAPQCHYRLL